MRLLFLLLLLLASATAQECITEADCPQNRVTPFCEGAFCISGYCVAKPPPCSTFCSEALKACVGCETNADCAGNAEGEICDAQQHVCRPCYDAFDCPEGDFCYGGQWDCFGGRCVPPAPIRRPCADVRQCHEASRSCTGCVSDAQCGPYDFCTNNRRCNATSGQCEGTNGNQLCESRQMFCSSEQARCVQCRTTADCHLFDASFCQPSLVCALPTQYCRPALEGNDVPPTAPCNAGDRIEACDEERKLCLPRLCVDDEECQDGNGCNGRERCIAGACARPAPERRTCPDGQYCSDGVTCAIECLSASDCAELAYVCKKRDVGGVDGIKTLCVPCRTDAECQNGIAEDGFETCDQETGQCQAGVSPCRGAPPGSVYDPRTGLCAPPSPASSQQQEPTTMMAQDVGGATTIGTASLASDLVAQTSGFPWLKMLFTVVGVATVATLLVVVTSPAWAASKWRLWRRRTPAVAPSPPPSLDKEDDDGEEEQREQVASEARFFSGAYASSGREPIDNW